MCATSILLYALLLVIGVQPWWSPQYLIPILGEPGHTCVELVAAVFQGQGGTWHASLHVGGRGSRALAAV
jgi:hypothetical protein